MRLTRDIAIFMHLLGVGLQFANAAGLIVPAAYQEYFALVVAAAQGVLGWFQHHFNPDGTPATVAFIPKA